MNRREKPKKCGSRILKKWFPSKWLLSCIDFTKFNIFQFMCLRAEKVLKAQKHSPTKEPCVPSVCTIKGHHNQKTLCIRHQLFLCFAGATLFATDGSSPWPSPQRHQPLLAPAPAHGSPRPSSTSWASCRPPRHEWGTSWTHGRPRRASWTTTHKLFHPIVVSTLSQLLDTSVSDVINGVVSHRTATPTIATYAISRAPAAHGLLNKLAV